MRLTPMVSIAERITPGITELSPKGELAKCHIQVNTKPPIIPAMAPSRVALFHRHPNRTTEEKVDPTKALNNATINWMRVIFPNPPIYISKAITPTKTVATSAMINFVRSVAFGLMT